MKTDFQQLLNQFKGNLVFKKMIGELQLSPDEYIYMLETDQGIYYIFETDYISDFNYIIKQVKERTKRLSNFIEAKQPFSKFEDIPAAKYYTSPKYYPHDFDRFKDYLSSTPESSYFTFLIQRDQN